MHSNSPPVPYVSLCSGYEGIGIGLHRCIPNLRAVAYCEREAFAIANLVSKMEAGLVDEAPVFTDVTTFPWADFAPFMAGGILSFGWPCQPVSMAGKRQATADERWLFDLIADGIAIMRPAVLFAENVEGLLSAKMPDGSSVFGHCIERLEKLHYKVEAGLFSASEVGAPHQRKRVFILAVRRELAHAGYLSRYAEQWQQQEEHTEELQGGVELAYRNDTGLEGLRQCGGQEGRQKSARHAGSSGNLWPSRPGEPQHDWEPPRVVGNSAQHMLNGTGHTRQERRAEPPDTGIRQTESGLGLYTHGNACFLGSPLTVDVDSNRICNESNQANPSAFLQRLRREDGTSAVSNLHGEHQILPPAQDMLAGVQSEASPGGHKTRAREVLFALWRAASEETIQRQAGEYECILAEEVLRSGLRLDSFTQRICYFVWCVQSGNEVKGWGLRGMWLYESGRNPSQGSEPLEQLKRELGYALCQLSYEIALERGQDTLEAKGILQGVREASERAWSLSQALPEMEEIWKSTLNQTVWEQGCFVEATSVGNRTDELRLLGNGVVPATAALAFRVLSSRLSPVTIAPTSCDSSATVSFPPQPHLPFAPLQLDLGF
jgi:DNA (cytosine-5)-methyltransferase 1